MRRLHTTFQFFDTKEDALIFEKTIIKHRRGVVTEWNSTNGKEHKWIAWYKW